MEFYQVISGRRTCRAFLPKQVEADVLERILSAGLSAPSNDHLRQWEFVVLRQQEEKENALQFVKNFVENHPANPAVTEGNSPRKKMYDYAMPRQYSMLMDSACVILPFFKAAPGVLHPQAVNSLNSFAAVWCCIENILLAATAEGLGCSLRIPVGEEGANVARLMGAPKDYLLPCYLGIGYPAPEEEKLEQVEPQVAERIHFGRW